MNQQTPLGLQFSGGCYIGFNAAISTKSVEQLMSVVGQAVFSQFTDITICMASTGGDPEAALYAYNLLQALSKNSVKLATHNIGAVASAAIILFMAGECRYGGVASTFLFHDTDWRFDGRRLTGANLLERATAVKGQDDGAAKIIAEKTGQPLQSVSEWLIANKLMAHVDACTYGVTSETRELAIPKNAWFIQVVVPS